MKGFRTFVALYTFALGVTATARQKTVELGLATSFGDREGWYIYTNISVGTPGQIQTLLVDTGSSDTIIHSFDTPVCMAEHRCIGGTFDASKSSTMNNVSLGGLAAGFASGSPINGDFITDVVQINDLSITNVQMGLARDIVQMGLARDVQGLTNNSLTGILGLAYSTREQIRREQNGKTETPYYPNFVEALVKAKAISSRLFSLYPNRLDQYGSILFGGVDTEKYDGPLTTLSLMRSALSSEYIVDGFDLRIQELTMQPSDGSNQTLLSSTENETFPVVIDSGGPLWTLPARAVREIYANVGGGIMRKPCEHVARGIDNTTHFQLTLAGSGTNTVTINLELADLFIPVVDPTTGNAFTDKFGRAECQLMVAEHPRGLWFIGSPILRTGYWVFDLDNGQVSVGKANLGANSSNIIQVEAGVDGLSKAVKNVRAEAQKIPVAGQLPTSVTYKLSTASNTVGYATGAESWPTIAGTTRQAIR